MDWVDSDQNVTLPGGAEDLDYLNLSEQPYRAANRMMSSPSELRLIKGFEDPEVYRKLAPYVTALPTVTPINVNTAGPVILRLFDDSINEGVAEKLTRLVPPAEDGTPVQPLEPFEEAGDFYTELRAQLSLNPDDKLAIIGFEVFSSHFLMTVDATTGDTTVRLHSVLTRANNQVRVMLRGLGNYSG
jgi:general secretion pathway protein K